MPSSSRTPYTSTPNEVLTSANFEKHAKGGFGYATTTTDQGSISTSEVDLTSMTATITVGSSRLLWLVAAVPMRSTSANDRLILRIKEGSTLLGDDQQTATEATLPYVLKPSALVIAPSAGSHTYKLTASLGGGASGTGSTFHDSIRTSYLLVVDFGPSF